MLQFAFSLAMQLVTLGSAIKFRKDSMRLFIFVSILMASIVAQAGPCATGNHVFLTDVVCVKATCASIKGTEVDSVGNVGSTRIIRTGAFQIQIRENLEYWEDHCSTRSIPTPCVDAEYCVDNSNTVIGFPQYSH